MFLTILIGVLFLVGVVGIVGGFIPFNEEYKREWLGGGAVALAAAFLALFLSTATVVSSVVPTIPAPGR